MAEKGPYWMGRRRPQRVREVSWQGWVQVLVTQALRARVMVWEQLLRPRLVLEQALES